MCGLQVVELGTLRLSDQNKTTHHNFCMEILEHFEDKDEFMNVLIFRNESTVSCSKKLSLQNCVGSLCGVLANLLNCSIIVNEFKHRLLYYIYFWTNAPWERYESLYLSQLWIKSVILNVGCMLHWWGIVIFWWSIQYLGGGCLETKLMVF